MAYLKSVHRIGKNSVSVVRIKEVDRERRKTNEIIKKIKKSVLKEGKGGHIQK